VTTYTYLPRKDERLSQPGWLTYSGRFTHISGHPSAAGRVQDSESSPVKDRRSTTVPRNQPVVQQNKLMLANKTPYVRLSDTDVLPLCHATNQTLLQVCTGL